MNISALKSAVANTATFEKFKNLNTLTAPAFEGHKAVRVKVTSFNGGIKNNISVRLTLADEILEAVTVEENASATTLLDILYPQGWRVKKVESLTPQWEAQEPKQNKNGEVDMKYGVPHFVNFSIANKAEADVLITPELLAQAVAEPQF